MTIHVGWLFLIALAFGAWWYFTKVKPDHSS
jgi:hypothetical protein